VWTPRFHESEAIENPEELEAEVFEAEDIQDTILDKTEQIKHFLKRQNLIKVATEPHPISGNSVQSSSLNATATAYVPLVSPPQDVQSQLLTSSSHGSISSQSSAARVSCSRLPKLSLPTFNQRAGKHSGTVLVLLWTL